MNVLFTILIIISMYFIFKGTIKCYNEPCICEEQKIVYIDDINSQRNSKITQLYSDLFNNGSIIPNQIL